MNINFYQTVLYFNFYAYLKIKSNINILLNINTNYIQSKHYKKNY